MCSGSVNNALPITVTTPNGYMISPSTVSPGGEFAVSAASFKADSTLVLGDGAGGIETLKIHTSCSQLLEVGNVFGDLTLTKFNGQTGGSTVTYTYVVTNNGLTAQNNIFLEDDQLGPLAGPFSLQPGEMFTYSTTTQLNTTTTNVATAYVHNGSGRECEAMSQAVTVTVTPPPNCVEWANDGSVSGKKLTRSITNPTAAKGTISGITVCWPSGNGKLLKIKLDGDVVWDKKSAAGMYCITIPSSKLVKDAKKKSINPNKTRVFTLEFERNASTTLSNYTLTINFGSNCSLSAPPWQ
jgi:predicted Rdx family selenoprotein